MPSVCLCLSVCLCRSMPTVTECCQDISGKLLPANAYMSVYLCLSVCLPVLSYAQAHTHTHTVCAGGPVSLHCPRVALAAIL